MIQSVLPRYVEPMSTYLVKASNRINDGERTSAAMRRHNTRAERAIGTALSTLWAAIRREIKAADIIGAVLPAKWDIAIREMVPQAMSRDILPVLAGSAVAGSRHLRREWKRSTRKLDASLELDPALIADGWEWGGNIDTLRDYLLNRGSLLVKNVNTSVIETIQQILYNGHFVEELTTYEMARQIRNYIGVLPHHQTAIDTYLETLRAEGAAANTILRAQQRETRRLLNYRSRMIARTETTNAWNRGMRESMEAGLASGDVVGDAVAMMWWTATDERVCEYCGPLHEKVIGFNNTFKPVRADGERRLPEVQHPPAHIQCRCVVTYEPLDADEAREMGIDLYQPAEASPPAWRPAATIEEAEQWARDNVVRPGGQVTMDCDIDQANVFNETYSRLAGRWGIDRLDAVNITRKSVNEAWVVFSGRGTVGFNADSDLASKMLRDTLESRRSLCERLAEKYAGTPDGDKFIRLADGWARIIDSLGGGPRTTGGIHSNYLAGASSLDQLRAALIHEFGHILHLQNPGYFERAMGLSPDGAGWVDFAVTSRGEDNWREAVAEAFAVLELGGAEMLPAEWAAAFGGLP